MRVDAHVARSARETLVILKGDMLARILIDVLLGKAKINHVDDAVTIIGLAAN